MCARVRSSTAHSAAALAAACCLSLRITSMSAAAQCTADIDGNAQVNGTDLTVLLSAWGTNGQGTFDSDLNDDGIVGGLDLTIVLSGWGACGPIVPAWATLIEAQPDPAIIPSATLRAQIAATGYAWHVRDTQTEMEMLLVPPGTFTMGCSASQSSACSADEGPVHQVTLTAAFYLGRFEVTQSQWTALVGSNPSQFQGDGVPDAASRPVEQIPWEAAAQFVETAGMRLPTEAEWEYAYRAGTTTAFHGTPSVPEGTSEDMQLGARGWFSGNNGAQGTPAYGTKAVGQKAPNGLGMHDMAGNVFEWVNDWWGNYESLPQVNPSGPLTGSFRVLRGGNWLMGAANCRSSARYLTVFPSAIVGFRAARNP